MLATTRVRLRPLLKYTLIGGLIGGTAASLRTNQYQWDSIGVVRLGRAAFTVFQIGVIYKKDLYGKGFDKKSLEYKEQKCICHKKSAEKLLELCCTNKGVYIKVGQHIAALEYLLPTEYVETMKVLHSHAPTNKIEDVYKVIKEDFKKDVSLNLRFLTFYVFFLILNEITCHCWIHLFFVLKCFYYAFLRHLLHGIVVLAF